MAWYAAGVTSADRLAAPIHEQRAQGGSFATYDGGRRVAVLDYRTEGDRVYLDHTYVDPALRGQGVAERLLDAVVDWARAHGLRLVPLCSYTVVVLNRRDDVADVLAR